MPSRSTGAADLPNGPRAEAWKRVQEALDEGKPKSAREALAGVEEAAIAEQAWAEAARAIATRIVAETGDRPADDPQRLVLLARAIDQAPPETRPVLEAIRANWTWRYFEMNRWRFQQRTSGGAATDDLARIAEWDLPAIVGEIRARFAAALDGGGALETLPVGEWTAVIAPGSDARRLPAHRGRRGRPRRDRLRRLGGTRTRRSRGRLRTRGRRAGAGHTRRVSGLEAGGVDRPSRDADSPLVHAARLYRRLLDFHAADVDRTAFLAADLDRILWAAGARRRLRRRDRDRPQGGCPRVVHRPGGRPRALAALAAPRTRRRGPGSQTTSSRPARSPSRAPTAPDQPRRQALQEPPRRDRVAAAFTGDGADLGRALARRSASPTATIEQVHLRLAKADWTARLGAGKPRPGWLDDDDRRAILALPAVKTLAVDLPATTDFQAHGSTTFPWPGPSLPRGSSRGRIG